MAALFIVAKKQTQQLAQATNSPWQFNHGWRLNETATLKLDLQMGETKHALSIAQQQQQMTVALAQQLFDCQVNLAGDELSAVIAGHRMKVRVSQYQDTISIFIKHQRYDIVYQTEVTTAVDGADHAGSLTAPMNGTIVAVLCSENQSVKAGETLVIMEAMKMEYAIKAPKDGVVKAVFYAAGDLVKDGAELVDFSAEEA